MKDAPKVNGTVVVDVSQEPEKRYRGVRAGEAFFTILANHGLLLRVDRHAAGMSNVSALTGPPYSMLLCADLYSLMGFPVTEAQANAAGGAFSFCRRGRAGPPTRNSKTLKHAVGNTMHVAHIGAVLAVVLLRLPMLTYVEGVEPVEPEPLKKKTKQHHSTPTTPATLQASTSASSSAAPVLSSAAPSQAQSLASSPGASSGFSGDGGDAALERLIKARYRRRHQS